MAPFIKGLIRPLFAHREVLVITPGVSAHMARTTFRRIGGNAKPRATQGAVIKTPVVLFDSLILESLVMMAPFGAF